MKALRNRALPRFVCDLLSSPPRRGGGLNLWLYRVARVLHPLSLGVRHRAVTRSGHARPTDEAWRD